VSFPLLTSAEEKEVLTQLGVPKDAFDKSNAEDLICGTINRMKQYGSALSIYMDRDDAPHVVSTIRISRGDEEAIGMVCMKENEEYGTVKLFGTVRVNDDGDTTLDTNPEAFPDWANFDSVRISRKDLQDGTSATLGSAIHFKKYDKEKEPAFLGSKAPEQWELNIISLENGEWNSGMKKDAFGKYKKERPALTGLFGISEDSQQQIDIQKKGKDSKEKKSARSPKKKKIRKDSSMKKSKSASDRRGWMSTPKKTKT